MHISEDFYPQVGILYIDTMYKKETIYLLIGD